MTIPDFGWVKPKSVVATQTPANIPDFSWITPKQGPEEKQQGFLDYLGNLSKNFNNFKVGMQAGQNVGEFLNNMFFDPAKNANDPVFQQASSDLLKTFDHVFNFATPAGTIQELGNLGVPSGASLSKAIGGLPMGIVKPFGDLAELSSGLQLTEDDVRALTPEEKVQRAKSAMGLLAASAVAGPLATAIGPAGSLAGRIASNAGVGAVAGATYGGVAAAGEKDQLAQIISGGVMGGSIGLAHSLLFGKNAEPTPQTNPKPEELAQVRQVQLENNSPAETAKVAQALATSDDVAGALLQGKLGLKQGDIHIVPGVNPEQLSSLNAQLPEGYRSAIHIDKTGNASLLVRDETLPVDEKFFEKNGFLKDQQVSYLGQDHWSVQDVKGNDVLLKNLNDPGSIITANRNDVRLPPSVILDRAKATTGLYNEWQAAISAPFIENNKLTGSTESTNIIDRVPDLTQVNVQKHLDSFLSAKGFSGDDLKSLSRELQLKLNDEAQDAYLEPEEKRVINEVKKVTPDQQIADLKDLDRVAKSNGFSIIDGGSGRFVIRELDKNGNGKILAGFDDKQEALDWINKTGQATGARLDDNGIFDTSIAGNGLPPLPPEDGVKYSQDDPHNFVGTKLRKGESLIRFFDRFGLVTRYENFAKYMDSNYNSQIYNRVVDKLSKAFNIRNAQMQPFADEFSKNIGNTKLTREQRIPVGDHMQTMTPQEIIARGIDGRVMNVNEIQMASRIAKSGVDTDKIYKYQDSVRRWDKAIPQEQRQADPAKEAEYNQNIRDAQAAFGMDNNHLQYAQLFDVIRTKPLNEFALGSIVRLANAIKDESLSQAEFAAKERFTGEQRRVSSAISDMYTRLGDKFGIIGRIGGFMTHARLFFGGDVKAATEEFYGQAKAKDFYAKLNRTGEISAYERDPVIALQRYMIAGFNEHSGFSKAIAEATNALNEEIAKLPDGERDHAKKLMTRFIKDIQGIPGAADRSAQEGVNNILQKFQFTKNKDINVRSIINAVTSTVAFAGLGFRPQLGIGHFGISTLLSIAKRSHSYTERVLAAGSKAIIDRDTMQELQDKGVLAGLSPISTMTKSEYAQSLTSKIGQGYNKLSDVAFKATLLPTAYDMYAAGHYITANADALSALTKWSRGELTWKQVQDATFLRRFDQPVSDKFEQLARGNHFEDASSYLGRQAIKDLVGVYGAGSHPYLWGTNLGRILGQFGNYAMFVRGALQQGISRGTWGERVTFTAKLAGYSAALGYIGNEMGVDLNRMSPLHAAYWMLGSPLFSIAKDVTDAVHATGYTQKSAENRLKKLVGFNAQGNFDPGLLFPNILIPGSYAIDGVIKGIDDINSGNPVLGGAETLGFRKNQAARNLGRGL